MEEDIQNQIDTTAKDSQFTLSPTSAHTHNGTDSLRVDISNIARFPSTATNGQTITFNTATNQWVTSASFTSPLTTKGDIFGFTTVNARVPVGTNGQVLSSDSTQATGLNWVNLVASNAGIGSGPATSSTQTITHGLGKTPTVIRIYAHGGSVGSTVNQPALVSIGIWIANNNYNIYDISVDGGTNGTTPTGTSGSAINVMEKNQNTGSGVIGNVGATTFNIVWTISATIVNVKYLWEVQ